MNVEALEAYWASVKDTEWYQNHPILSSPDARIGEHLFFFKSSVAHQNGLDHVKHRLYKDCDTSRCIPLVIHGDDAESHRRRSFLVATIGSLLVSGNMFDTKLVCYVLDNSRSMSTTSATLDCWMTWAVMELQLGVYMDVDPWGRPLEWHSNGRSGAIMGGWRAILVCHKGDEKYIQKTYRTSHAAVSKYICVLCRASNDEATGHGLLYTRHGPQAAHRSTILSASEFIRDVAGLATWTTLPGWNVSFIQHDFLHVVDLTIIPECAASALVELVEEEAFGHASTADERLRLGYVKFIKACRQAKIRSRGVVFSMKLYLIHGSHVPHVLRMFDVLFLDVCVLCLFSILDSL